jgi:hypothetical protein
LENRPCHAAGGFFVHREAVQGSAIPLRKIASQQIGGLTKANRTLKSAAISTNLNLAKHFQSIQPPPPMSDLSYGIYEELLTSALQKRISEHDDDRSIAQLESLEEKLLPDFLTRSLHEHIRRKISGINSQTERYHLANQILDLLHDDTDDPDSIISFIDSEENLLTSVHPKAEEKPLRPSVPLRSPSLFTGATGSPQLSKELELEFETANRIDFLVSFIKNSGLNLIYPALKRFSERGGKLRIITTTYMGASEPTAVEKLCKLPGTQVKVSYDTRSSRLHAKAYFIHRDSGLSVLISVLPTFPAPPSLTDWNGPSNFPP